MSHTSFTSVESTDDVIARVRNHAPACFGGPSVFSHASSICTICVGFSACDDACLVTLEQIKGRVDVTKIIERHMAGRAKLGRSVTTVAMALPAPICGAPVFAPESTMASANDGDLKEAAAVIAKAKAATVELTPADVVPMIAAPEPVSTPPAKVEPKVSVTAGEPPKTYKFPAVDGMSAMNDAELMEMLNDLVYGIKSPDDYSGIRTRYCEVSIELNIRGLWAPAFRPSITIPLMAKKRQESHMLVHRDRLMIDCHWIHSKKMDVYPEQYWRPLFKGPPFRTDLAEEFATREAASDYRTETILGLTTLQQLQLKALRGAEVAAHKKAIVKHERDKDGRLVTPRLRAITAVINRWCEVQPKIRAQRSKFIAHAEARLLLEAVVTPTWREVAELGGLIQGVKPLGDKTVSDFMKNLDLKVKALATPVKL